MPSAPTSRSPRSTPGLRRRGCPSTTPRTSRPSRSGRPTARAHAPRGARRARARRRAAAAPAPRRRASASARRCSAASAGSARISPPSQPHRVEAEQPARRRRPAGRRTSRAAAARCARSSRRCGARAGRGTSARSRRRARTSRAGRGRRGWRARAPARRCRPHRGRSGSHATAGASPVSTAIDGEVEVRVGAGHAAVLGAPVGERHRDLLAAQHVRVGEHAPGRDHDAGPAAPAAAEADHRRARRARRAPATASWSSSRTRIHGARAPSHLQLASRQRTRRRRERCPQRRSAVRSHERAATPPTSPLADALARVGDRWTLLVVAALLEGPKRFNELQEELDGIAPNVLSARLKALDRAGAVVARPYSERPPRFVYELTRVRPRAGRRAAAARRLGRAQRRRRRAAAPRRVRRPRSRRAGGARPASSVVDDPDAEDEVVHV